MEYEDKLSCIENILVPILLPLGFSFDSYDEGQDGYGFEFTRNDQLIEIYDKLRYINMRFIINRPRRRVVSARLLTEADLKLLDSPKPIEYDYKLEEDFKNIILTFKEIILGKGLKKMQEMSHPLEAPTRNQEYFQFLKCHKKDVISEYMTKRRDQSPERELSNIELYVNILSYRLFEDVVYKLIEIAAIYGDWIIRNFGGKWQEFDGIYGIREVGKRKDVVIPTDDIFNLWEKGKTVTYKAYNIKFSE